MSDGLNKDQRLAAECLDRPVLVTAGAGSGKTRMLTQRFVNAVVEGAVPGWEPAKVDEILAITFTEKAAEEISARVRLALAEAGRIDAARQMGDAWISTIHGACSRILRRDPFQAGVDPLFGVADTVLTGELRAEAFEVAARRVVIDDRSAEALFEGYRFQPLFSAVQDVARQLSVAGMDADELELETVEPLEVLLQRAQALFENGTLSSKLGYSGSSAEPDEHASRCREHVEECSLLGSIEEEEGRVLAALLELLEAYKPLSGRVKSIQEFAEGQRAATEALKGRVAATLTAPFARAFVGLVREYAREYEERKAALGVLDFDDLQVKAARLLAEHKSLAEAYHERFRVVMIDEFQDTDLLQLRLVEAIADGAMCTVGDENQSIYRFRGADVEVYREHRDKMREAEALIVPLDINYRSHPQLLDFVNGVFGSAEYLGRRLLRLRPPEEAGPPDALDEALEAQPRAEVALVDCTALGEAGSRRQEAAFVAKRLAELAELGAGPGEMAVLLRSYRYAHVYAQALSYVGLPAVVVGGSRFFGLPEVAIMRALTRVIANPEDDSALGVLLASDFVPLSSDALARTRLRGTGEERQPLWQLLCETAEELEGSDAEAAKRLVRLVEGAERHIGREPLAHLLMRAVEESGWDLRLLSSGNGGRDAFANVLKFLRHASEFEAAHGSSPGRFARHLDDKEALGDTEAPTSLADDEAQAVRIMSIHASKGLEFPIVAVPELGAGGRGGDSSVRIGRTATGLAVALKTPVLGDREFGSRSTLYSLLSDAEKLAAEEEDARILYVAFTRTEKYLLATGSMRLRTKKESSSQRDIAKLGRILGVSTPIEEASDQERSIPGAETRCRVRVIVPETSEQGAATDADSEAAPDAPVLPPAANTPVSPYERELVPRRLSYTQLSEFERCPRRFWVRRALGVRADAAGQAGEPGPLEFGNALHTALQLVGSTLQVPPAERIAAIARLHGLAAEQRERLEAAVGRYCRSKLAAQAAAHDSVRREAPFTLRIDERFLLTGALDLYARTGERGLVVDYKSGESGDQSELSNRYRLQAECYALAAFEDGCSAVEVEFVRPEVVASDGEPQSVRFEFSAGDRQRIEVQLRERCALIAASDFAPRRSDACWTCDVVEGLCPSVGPGRRG